MAKPEKDFKIRAKRLSSSKYPKSPQSNPLCNFNPPSALQKEYFGKR
jgi:hypothetical protein